MEALFDDSESLLVSYVEPIDAGDFNLTDFHTDPTTIEPTIIAQSTPTELLLSFAVNISAEFTLTYVGTVANILTPQTVNLT